MPSEKNYFSELYAIDVSSKVEKKNNLTYLSWAWAWGELKKRYPDSNYTIYENKDGLNYHTDGRTAWVKVGVTVNGLEHIEYLPVMDYKNASISVERLTSFDVNKSIQRALTKAIGRHGLGLYIYAGEDLPETESNASASPVTSEAKPRATKQKKAGNIRAELVDYCTAHDIDITKIARDFKLTNNASDEAFTNALNYCKHLIEVAEGADDLINDIPQEV